MEQENYKEVENGLVKRGGFGAVRPVERKSDGKVLACKHIAFDRSRYRTQLDFKQLIEKEVHLLKHLDHPNIVRYYDMQLVAGGQAINIYTEWLQDQNLDSYVSTKLYSTPEWPSERETWNLICQLSAALAYCHNGLIRDKASLPRAPRILNQKPWDLILHRDVKPDNILVQCKTSGQTVFKLCDFGLSIIPSETEQLSFGGTNFYIAPEVTRDNPQWSDKADIFALGCTLFYFYKREAPWRYQLTMTSSSPMPVLPKHASQDVKDLIYKCISTDAKDRPDAETIFMQSLEHLEEEDRALASVETSHTMSEIVPQGPGLQSPDPLSKSIPVGPLSPSAQANKSSTGSKTAAALTQTQPQLGAKTPVISHPVQPADIAVPRRTIDSFFRLDSASVRSQPAPTAHSLNPPEIPKTVDRTASQSALARLKSYIGENRRSKALDTKRRQVDKENVSKSKQLTSNPRTIVRKNPSIASTNFASTSSTIFNSAPMNFGHGSAEEEVDRLIGSLAVDYYHYPPLDMFCNIDPEKRRVTMINLCEQMTFAHTHSDIGPRSKGIWVDMLSTSSRASSNRTEVSVEVQLDGAMEFQLQDFEGYFDYLMQDHAPRTWVHRKKLQNRRVYLIVGYIVYKNARVNEGGGRTDGTAMFALDPQVEVGPVSMGSTNNNAHATKRYEKIGKQTQGVYVREVSHDKHVDSFSMGEIETAYFWGPKVHPLSSKRSG